MLIPQWIILKITLVWLDYINWGLSVWFLPCNIHTTISMCSYLLCEGSKIRRHYVQCGKKRAGCYPSNMTSYMFPHKCTFALPLYWRPEVSECMTEVNAALSHNTNPCCQSPVGFCACPNLPNSLDDGLFFCVFIFTGAFVEGRKKYPCICGQGRTDILEKQVVLVFHCVEQSYCT